MKVVHIFKDFYPPTTGGIEQHMNLLCRKLAQQVDVAVLVPSRSFRKSTEQLEGFQIIRVPEFGRYASVPLCLTAPLELRRLRPDIVHLHYPNPMGDLAQLTGAAPRYFGSNEEWTLMDPFVGKVVSSSQIFWPNAITTIKSG